MSYSILLACTVAAWATLSLLGSERVRRQRDAEAAKAANPPATEPAAKPAA